MWNLFYHPQATTKIDVSSVTLSEKEPFKFPHNLNILSSVNVSGGLELQVLYILLFSNCLSPALVQVETCL